MNKIFNLICCLAFFPVYLSAQIGYSLPNARGFFMSDSFSMAGVEIDDAGNLLNSKYCTVKIGPGKVVYTPYTVNKYSIDGKNIYKSFTVQINNRAERYFLKRKAKDKFELYFLQLEGGIKKFYLTKIDSSILYEIPASTKEDSSFLLKLITECPGSNNYLKFLRPNTNAIKLFLEYTKKCLENPFPKFQYGILIGLNANNFLLTTNNKIYSKLKLISDWKISLGAFMEIPLYKFNLSFHPELFYVENSCSNSFYYHQFIYNLVINYSSIRVPLLLRYSLLNSKLSPFFQAGPVYSFALRNQSQLYKFENINSNIYIDFNDSRRINNNLGGFTIGTGLISRYGLKHSWFSELRYTRLYNIGPGLRDFDFGDLSFLIGILF